MLRSWAGGHYSGAGRTDRINEADNPLADCTYWCRTSPFIRVTSPGPERSTGPVVQVPAPNSRHTGRCGYSRILRDASWPEDPPGFLVFPKWIEMATLSPLLGKGSRLHLSRTPVRSEDHPGGGGRAFLQRERRRNGAIGKEALSRAEREGEYLQP